MLAYQTWVMAAALLLGLLIAFFYDIYWLLFAYRRRPWWRRALEDLLFWLAVFIICAALWLYLTGGVMRLSVYLWLMLGGIIYPAACRRFLRRRRKRTLPADCFCPPPPPIEPPKAPADAPPKREVFRRRLEELPEKAMLEAGIGFWRATAWLHRELQRGLGLVKARLPKPKEPPKEPPPTEENSTEIKNKKI